MPTVVKHVTPSADQENVSPNEPVANVRNAARKAMAHHIDNSANKSKKGSRRERFSDAKTIENVFSSIDGIAAIFSLVEDVFLYLDSSANSDSVGLSLVGKALKYASASGRIQLSKIRSAIDNTKSKREAPLMSKTIYCRAMVGRYHVSVRLSSIRPLHEKSFFTYLQGLVEVSLDYCSHL